MGRGRASLLAPLSLSIPYVTYSIFREAYFSMEYAVAQLVKALRYKPTGRGFDSQWCNWNFLLT
jgi:hypothetical protein